MGVTKKFGVKTLESKSVVRQLMSTCIEMLKSYRFYINVLIILYHFNIFILYYLSL